MPPNNVETFVKTLRYEEILVFTPGDVESSQVQTVVIEAKKRQMKITIKNGGRPYAGFSTAGQGISLELIKMNTATLSDKNGSITLQGGCTWGNAYKQLVNNHLNGFVINGGRCPTVGVSGFLLGGGLGPISRSLGMGCDSLQEATIVTADGKLITISKDDRVDSDEGRLFWALRGGGGGNFGVVVELKMPVQRLSGDSVVAGRFTWTPTDPASEGPFRTMNKFYTSDWPRRTTIDTSWLQTAKDDFQVRFLVYHDGDKDSFNEALDNNITTTDDNNTTEAELREKLKQRTLPEVSTRFLHETLVDQWSEEIVKAFPTNRTFMLYTSFVFRNDETTIKTILPIVHRQMADFKQKFTGETVLLQFTCIHAGGSTSDKNHDESAVPWREGVYFSYIMMQWEQKYLEYSMREFLKNMKEKLRPHSLKRRAAFINFADPELISSKSSNQHAYYDNNYEKLQKVKDRWDEDNFFDWDQGVKPSNVHQDPVEDDDQTDRWARKRFNQFEPSLLSGILYQGLNGMLAVGGLSGAQKPTGLCDMGY